MKNTHSRVRPSKASSKLEKISIPPGTTTSVTSLLAPPTTIVSLQSPTPPAPIIVQPSPVVYNVTTPFWAGTGATTVWTAAGRGRGTLPTRPAPAGRGNSYIQSPPVTQISHNAPITSTISPTTPVLQTLPGSALSECPKRNTKPPIVNVNVNVRSKSSEQKC